ncbi:MAG: hypothetical protein ACLGH0_01230, partial [Thermoanaerobaculia bacterium]
MRAIPLTLFLFLGATSVAAAPNPRIENLTATAAHGKVSVKFSLAGAFANGEIVDGLQSGVPTTFTY